MVLHKRKKNRRFRGTRECGWGKVHRGAGMRGGRGNAGSGKKADVNKPSFADRRFGRFGFTPHNSPAPSIVINLRDVEQKMDNWLASKQASHASGVYTVDLGKIGYTKLLSSGKVSKKVNITIDSASSSAEEKVKAAGGQVQTAKPAAKA